MAPPKNDVFADLFLATAGNLSSSSINASKLPMLHRQNQQHKPMNGSNKTGSTLANTQDHWSHLDVLSGSQTPVGGTNTTQNTTLDDDPFAIFSQPEPKSKPPQKPNSIVEPTFTHSAPRNLAGNLVLLLDDEFSDAFPAEKQQEPPAKVSQQERKPRESSNSPTDSVLAQLIDIGFSVDASNDAIAKNGPNLQDCVNYIMSGGNTESSTQRATPIQHQDRGEQDIQAKLTDLSTDFFNKASIFFDKSKKTVMKNIDQFQQQHRGQSPRSKSQSPSMPLWMTNQEMYKKDAVERKANGGSYEDYGSDEDNLDQEAIAKFMREQQQRDKERNSNRINALKSLAADKISGRPNSSLGRSSPVKKPPVPARARLEPPESDELPRRPTRKTKTAAPKPQPAVSKSPDEDLLGLNAPLAGFLTAAALNEFQQTDFDTHKEKATQLFGHGDYDAAYQSYLRCMESLPEDHDFRIVIHSNAALTLIRSGNYKEAKNHCNTGIQLVNAHGNLGEWVIMDKAAKFWYVKLVSRKAESLEMLEAFPEALDCYMELVSKLGVVDKKVMDGKRRVNDIVNPKAKKPAPKPAPKAAPTVGAPGSNLSKLQKQNADNKAREEEMFRLHDVVHEQILAWSSGKEDNIRTLLTTLPDIIPERLGFPFVTDKKIELGDLMLPKKVKINYMKVISAIHPDKLSSLQLQDKMICQGVFVALNKAWDLFKEQNNMN